MKNKFVKVSYRFLLILLSCIFVFAGIDKIILRNEMVEVFKILGFPKEFMIVVGFTELILAILLQVRYFTKLALHGLIFILSVAVLLHLLNSQYYETLLPISLISTIIVTLHLGQAVRNLNTRL